MGYDDSAAHPAGGIAADDPLPPENRARNADVSADAIFSQHQPSLVRFIERRAPAQDVGDLVQECFRRLLSSSAYPRVLSEQPGAYLYRTARNLLAERHRTDERRMVADHQSFEEPEIAGPDPHTVLEERDQMRRVVEALARLRPRTRDIFLMHRFDGLRYDDIAAAKGISVKGVEKQIAKAMVAIRRARTGRR